MNKYDKKVLRVAPKSAKIYELLQKKDRGAKGQIIELLFDSILSVGEALKQIETRGAYYLVMNDHKAELVRIHKDLAVSNQDITSLVQISSGKKQFVLDGYKYKLYRKVQ